MARMSITPETKPQDNNVVKEPTAETATQYPTKERQLLILLCLVLGTFLVAIDTTIISVAIPTISTDFKALDDVGWYGSAYLLTLTAFQPTMSKIYKIFPSKKAYVASVAIFEGVILLSWLNCRRINPLYVRAHSVVPCSNLANSIFETFREPASLSASRFVMFSQRIESPSNVVDRPNHMYLPTFVLSGRRNFFDLLQHSRPFSLMIRY